MTRILSVFNQLKRVGFAVLLALRCLPKRIVICRRCVALPISRFPLKNAQIRFGQRAHRVAVQIAICAFTCPSIAQWQPIGLQGINCSSVIQHPSIDSVFFASSIGIGGGAIFRSSDGGIIWDEVVSSQDLINASWSFHPSNADIIIVPGRQNYWLSTNCGSSWSQHSSNLIFPTNAIVYAAFCYGSPNTMFLTARGEGVSNDIYRSDDGGETFETTNEHAFLPVFNIFSFPSTPNTVFFTPYGPVTTDAGDHWEDIDSEAFVSEFWDLSASTISETPLVGIRVQLQGQHSQEYSIVRQQAVFNEWEPLLYLTGSSSKCVVNPINTNIISVSDSNANRILVSTNGGVSWDQDQDPVIADLLIQDITSSNDGRYLYIASLNGMDSIGGIWRRASSMHSADDYLKPPVLALGVYPNPCNSAFTVSYFISKPVRTELSVFDIRGRLVATIRSGWLSVGHYLDIYESKDLASGSYIISLEANGLRSAKQLYLIK